MSKYYIFCTPETRKKERKKEMIVHHGVENMLALYYKLYDRKASTIQNTLGNFLQRNKTFQFSKKRKELEISNLRSQNTKEERL